MRLFLAIELTQESIEHIARLQGQLEGDVKRVNPNQAHITIVFLGDDNPERIDSALQDFSFEPFTLQTTDVGFFGKCICWLGVEQSEHLSAVVSEIDEKLGYNRDRSFKPHITIARCKKVTAKPSTDESFEIPVRSINLMKSTLTSEGPVYEKLRSYS